MHAVGIFHEQSRADRDDHVKIAFQNIEEDNCHNFAKYDFNEIQHLDTPYDLSKCYSSKPVGRIQLTFAYYSGSVMHYGAYDFTKNGKPTIYVKKNDQLVVDDALGNVMRLSQVPQRFF